ncbi:MAG: 50S ribosomal protein L35 [Myxococcota bacterium]|nr:50S ribosomal protein L35 [Myxococcota bacterium]
MAKGPKMKTVSGAAKRFKKTKSGKILAKSANTSHCLTPWSSKRKRQNRGTRTLAKVDVPGISRCIPYK